MTAIEPWIIGAIAILLMRVAYMVAKLEAANEHTLAQLNELLSNQTADKFWEMQKMLEDIKSTQRDINHKLENADDLLNLPQLRADVEKIEGNVAALVSDISTMQHELKNIAYKVYEL